MMQPEPTHRPLEGDAAQIRKDVTMDESKFSVNERAGEYYAEFEITGTVKVLIKADSLEAAAKQANAMKDDDEFGLELDDVDWIEGPQVRPAPKMYRVWDNGRKVQVSCLKEHHEPREPDENGF